MAQTREIFVWTADHLDKLVKLEAALAEAAKDKSPLTMDETDPAAELRAEFDEVKAKAAKAGLRVTVRGLTDDEWYKIEDEHPPRTDDRWAEGDEACMMNARTGERPLIRAGLIEPKMETRADLDEWIKEKQLSRSDVHHIASVVWALTHGTPTADPKSLTPSVATRDDGPNSQLPTAGG